MKKQNYVIASIVMAVLITAVSCDKKNAAKNEQAVPVFAVSTQIAKKSAIQDSIALSGNIVAGSSVDVYSEVAGKITRLYVSVGRSVRKGDPIAAVDPSQPGMSYVTNTVRSPISGIVTNFPAQLGMQISPAVSLAQIAGGGALEIALFVSERDISKIKLGLPCIITLDAYSGESFKGSISEISPVVDPTSRTMEVKVNVVNQGSKLKAGMFATVRIIIQDKNDVITIPFSSVLQNGQDSFVYIVKSDPKDPAFRISARTLITTGIHTDDLIEITNGINDGDEVVVKGQTTLSDGARVNIISAPQTTTTDTTEASK
ncbi:MAG: efflux RND transporter periplasmic adaptor subunit [Spirochaetaceae bacterium]|jgi:multidrug efflux pump subunit AcrA (membrane-fusion protein)|nr:efflux RND transporter periplasmic adaptor subunit [Spirochaetaceae bacterium]